MQVACTLWPDIKSQKLSEHRLRLKSTKCSPRTEARPLKTGHTPELRQEEAQDSLLDEAGAVGAPRPSADQSMGPTALSWPCGGVPLAPYGGFRR